ncbi:hypothetical protein N2152v2_003847 [Parachlorella kessleri]
MVVLGDTLPNFDAETTQGPIKFHDFVDNSWVILFSHPSDFTPVCTSELGLACKYQDEFKKRGVKLIALSCNSLDSHKGWVKDIEGSMSSGRKLEFPIIADPDRKIAKDFGMLDPDEKDDQGRSFAARAVFIVGPDKTLKLSLLYIIRVVDSLQLADKYPLATPANWKQGEEVMISPKVSEEEAHKLFPDYRTISVQSGKLYIRKTKVPEE